MVQGGRLGRTCIVRSGGILKTFWHWASCFAVLLAALVLLVPGGAKAQDPFVISDLPIEATAADSAQARDRAIAQGNETALRRLLERMTRRSDWSFLPRGGAGDLVESFELKNEQVTATRYAAAMTVRFGPARNQDLLRRNNIGYTEPAAVKPVIVLPVYEWAGTKTLWEDGNPWRAAWARRKGDTLVPLLVPQGDLSDRAALDANQAAAGDTARLTAIGRRYNAPSVAVIRANHFVDPASGRPVFELSLARFGEGAAVPGPPVRVAGNPNEPIEQLADRAVAQAASLIDEGYKSATVVSGEQPEEILTARVPLTSLAQAVKLRRDLTSLSVVRREEVLSMGRTEMQLRIAYVGGMERLRATLAQTNLLLEQQGDEWTLRPGTASPQ
jgi:hypothetical protein